MALLSAMVICVLFVVQKVRSLGEKRKFEVEMIAGKLQIYQDPANNDAARSLCLDQPTHLSVSRAKGCNSWLKK